MSHPSTLIQPEEGILGTSDLEPIKSTGNNLDLMTGILNWRSLEPPIYSIWNGGDGSFVGQSPQPVESDTISR